MTKMLLNQLNLNFFNLILVILFVQINPAVGKEKLNLTYDNIEVFLEGDFVQGGLVIGKSDPKIEIKFKNKLISEVENKASAYHSTDQIWDDGRIDPRETRNYLGFCLAVIYNQKIKGAKKYGVWRH